MKPKYFLPILFFALVVLLVQTTDRGSGSEPVAADDGWKDLPMGEAVVYRLEQNKGFLGPKEQFWGRLAKTRFSGMECVFMPNGAMVRDPFVPAAPSEAAIGKWFAKVYEEEKIFERGTFVKRGVIPHLFARGPEIMPRNVAKVKAFRKRGNVLEVRVVATGTQRAALGITGSLWWPLLDLPLEKFPPGTYALEVVWLDEQPGDVKESSVRQITAFAVLGNESE